MLYLGCTMRRRPSRDVHTVHTCSAFPTLSKHTGPCYWGPGLFFLENLQCEVP